MAVADSKLQRVNHQIDIAAPVSVVYGLVADVGRWPVIFPPTVHAEVIEQAAGSERLRLWAFANGKVRTWTSRRELDPHRSRIDFRQETCSPPVAAMGGTWAIESRTDGGTQVVLSHDYAAVDDDPDATTWISAAVDRNSRAELAALRAAAEMGSQLEELSLSFTDSVRVSGDALQAYEFLAQADLWPQRLPHVDAVDLREDEGIQVMTMSTRAPGESVHVTESVRVCFAPERIVYKQVASPPLLAAHTGSWTIRPAGDALTVTSAHRVLLDGAAITTVLGAGATVAGACAAVRDALGSNSRATLEHARAFAEAPHG